MSDRTLRGLWLAACLPAILQATTQAADLAVVENVPVQPVAAQSRRVVEALESLGQPLSEGQRKAIDQAARAEDESEGVKAIQGVLDPLCLVGVTINPESRVKAQKGPAAGALVQGGWRVFLVKVQNEAGVTGALKVSSPNAAPVYKRSTGSPSPRPAIPEGAERDRWADVRMFDDRPMNPALSGLGLEYRILQVYSRDAGPREARLTFDVGQGTQDLGFRSDVDVLFECAESVEVVLNAREKDGGPVWAAYEIRDASGAGVSGSESAAGSGFLLSSAGVPGAWGECDVAAGKVLGEGFEGAGVPGGVSGDHGAGKGASWGVVHAGEMD